MELREGGYGSTKESDRKGDLPLSGTDTGFVLRHWHSIVLVVHQLVFLSCWICRVTGVFVSFLFVRYDGFRIGLGVYAAAVFL